MRKRVLFFIMLSCSLLMACGGVKDTGMGKNVSKYYEYPITPEDSEWKELGTVAEKIEACRIPIDTLEQMTEEELVQAILDFPFLTDLFVSAVLPPSLDFFGDECDAYKELLERENGKEALMEKLKEFPKDGSVETQYQGDALRVLLLNTQEWKEQLTEDEISELTSGLHSQVKQ